MKKRARPSRVRPQGKRPRRPLPVGKLPPHLLEKCLQEAVFEDHTVIQGPRVGADAAIVLPAPNELLVVTSDPITFTDTGLGPHLLAININDIVTTGAYPRWLVVDLLLPEGTGEKEIQALFTSIGAACGDHSITLIGGHTEITDAVNRPVAVGVLLGAVKKDRRVDPSRAQPGDEILLVGPIAVEGTALLAREFKEEVLKAFGPELQRAAEALLDNPGICVADVALLSVTRYLAHALHDPTEGGLATALRELAALTGWGVDVDQETIEILPETTLLCEYFGLDPFGLLASGSLLAVLPAEEAQRLSKALGEQLQCRSSIIGRLSDERECVWHRGGGKRTAIPEFERDEIARAFEARRDPTIEGGEGD